MTEIIITGVVGLFATIITSVVTWFLSKKKYNTEVDHDSIANMKEALVFYEDLAKSNNDTLTRLLNQSKQLAESNVSLSIEVQNLKAQVEILTMVIRTELKEFDLSKYGIAIEDNHVVREVKKKKNETRSTSKV